MDRLKPTPTPDARLAGWGLLGLGAVLIVLAGAGAGRATQTADRLSFAMSGGIGGVLSAVVGAVLVVRVRLREEWHALDQLDRRSVDDRARAAEGFDDVPPVNPSVGAWLRVQSDRVVGWVLAAAGVGLFLAVVPAVTDALYVPEQVSLLISGGIFSLFLVATGGGVLVLADLRDQDAKLDRLDGGCHPGGVGVGGRRLVLAACGVGLGAAVVVASWRTASTTVRTGDALAALAAATLGLGVVVAVLGATGVTIRRPMVGRIADLVPWPPAGGTAAAEVEMLEDGPAVFTAAGLHRFHRLSCPALVLAGADLQPAEGRDPRLEPCELCDAGV